MSLSVDMSYLHLPEPALVAGVRVDRVSQSQALDAIEQMIELRHQSGNQTQCQQVVTINPEFLMAAQQNNEFRHAINTAALVVADGMGIVWATRYLREPV